MLPGQGPRLEGNGIEEHKADAHGRRVVFLLVRTCDHVSHESGDASVLAKLVGCLFDLVPDDAGSGCYSVRTFQFQRKRAHVISKFSDGSATDRPVSDSSSAGTVQPPLNVVGIGKRCAGIFGTPQAVRVEDTEDADRLGKGLDPLLKLDLQRPRGLVPLAFRDHRVAAATPLEHRGFPRDFDAQPAPGLGVHGAVRP